MKSHWCLEKKKKRPLGNVFHNFRHYGICLDIRADVVTPKHIQHLGLNLCLSFFLCNDYFSNVLTFNYAF